MNAKTLVTVIVVAIVAATAVVGAVLYDARDQLPFLQTENDKPAVTDDNTPATDTPAEGDTDTPPEETQEPQQNDNERLAQAFAQEKENSFNLILVNKDNKIPDDFTVEREDVQAGFMMDARIADITKQMIDDAASQGVELLFCGAYRSGVSQESRYERLANDATEIPAGTSEHHTALAADIVTPTHQGLDVGFADTDAGEWLAEHAWKYGYILRYPEGKEDITGYLYEPWHFRYVGPLHAKLIKDSGLCLEEYLQQELPQGYTDDPAAIQELVDQGAIFLENDPAVSGGGSADESEDAGAEDTTDAPEDSE